MDPEVERSPRVPLVLVVDDTPEVREVYRYALSNAGLRVETAEGGLDGIIKSTCLRPDVVVMDLYMPGLDGLRTTRCLKADPRTRPIPVILCTSEAAEDSAREAGCDDFLRKPCPIADFTRAVKRHARVP